ncbi:MAG: D-glucuronyl C5-epimerase family protein [Fluviicola sp.]|nr:D-glucuronyl C5-epimerase family protein [Fluviicola sp.]
MNAIIHTISIVFVLSNAIGQQLLPYESLTHFDVEKYSKQYERTFDTNGIIVQKKEYHALTIGFYGIMNYDAFKQTGDSLYYRRVINQYNYFKDTSKLIFFNDQSLGLPYRFEFKGLKEPWYSGMTQGVAASFLLRYYDLTKDKEALRLSKQLINFMLKPESEGGTIGRTKEGELWIEEYPNLTSSKSVLNGFINGLIGLKEYCMYFPDDQFAASIHDSCYAALFHSLDKYNTANWTNYSRNSGPVTNSYMRYELEEFDHLYSMYHDVRLRDQMRIWAMFSLGKFDNELKFLKRPKYDFAAVLPYDKKIDGCSFNQYELFSKSMVNCLVRHSGRKKSKYELQKESYYCELRLTDQLLKTTQPQLLAFCNGKKVEITTEIKEGCLSASATTPFDAIKVHFKRKPQVDTSEVKLMVYDYRHSDIPQFACYTLSKKEYLTKGEVVKFTGNQVNSTGAKVYYRFGKKQDMVKDKKYSIEQSFDFETGSFVVQETGIYEFFVSYDITHPVSQINQMKIIHQ